MSRNQVVRQNFGVQGVPAPTYEDRLAGVKEAATANPAEFTTILNSKVFQAIMELAAYSHDEALKALIPLNNLETTNFLRGKVEAYQEQYQLLQKIVKLNEK